VNPKHTTWLAPRFITLTRVYFTFIFSWAILHLLFGDRWVFLFVFNSFAELLFYPLPFVLLIALFTRRRETWVGALVTLALFVYFYGDLFIPKPTPVSASSETLTVMTYNMLGFTDNPDAVIANLRASNADIIAIQELNPQTADAIRRDLREYPYQILDPYDGVHGLGVVSRLPLRLTNDTLPRVWIGTPQIFSVDWNGKPFTLIHVHTVPSNGLEHQSIDERENELRAVVDFVNAHHTTPILATGDFNMTDQNTCYSILTSVLRDSWREAGWGTGHTFPSTNYNGRELPHIASYYPFMWALRIDYIFHSPHWRTISADLGNWDGQSDHRPMIVKLVLEK
jgi:endonuclease/exonuclease/phosphatase (EEP) superfamily protein YafD